MGASHFFVGLTAGVAILAVPVLTLTPGMDLPHRFALWIDGPSVSGGSSNALDVVSRPRSGYTPGYRTPAAASPPTLEPGSVALMGEGCPGDPGGSSCARRAAADGWAAHRGASGWRDPVYVRRAAGVESPGDPVVADGSPVMVEQRGRRDPGCGSAVARGARLEWGGWLGAGRSGGRRRRSAAAAAGRFIAAADWACWDPQQRHARHRRNCGWRGTARRTESRRYLMAQGWCCATRRATRTSRTAD